MIAQHLALDFVVGDAIEEHIPDDLIGEVDARASCRIAASLRSGGLGTWEGVVAVYYQTSDPCSKLHVALAVLLLCRQRLQSSHSYCNRKDC